MWTFHFPELIHIKYKFNIEKIFIFSQLKLLDNKREFSRVKQTSVIKFLVYEKRKSYGIYKKKVKCDIEWHVLERCFLIGEI